VQLVIRDPYGVIDAPVQSHVETESEEAHGVGVYQNALCAGLVRRTKSGATARRNSALLLPSLPPNGCTLSIDSDLLLYRTMIAVANHSAGKPEIASVLRQLAPPER
jgi:hypothetical protein